MMNELTKENTYLDYVCERESLEAIHTEYGLMLLKREPDRGVMYIRDIYIAPAHRLKGYGRNFTEMANEIAKKEQLQVLVVTISPDAVGSTESLKASLRCGFELSASDKDIIYLTKKVK